MSEFSNSKVLGKAPDLENLLTSHPLLQSLAGSTDDIERSRSIFDIAPEDREENFVSGTMAQPSCFPEKPAVAVSCAKHTVIATYCLGTGLSGHKGFAHGGAIATILDEVCGRAAVSKIEARVRHVSAAEKSQQGQPSTRSSQGAGVTARKQSGAVTASLAIRYIAPVQVSRSILVKANVEEGGSERKFNVKGQLWMLGDKVAGKEDVLCAEAQALFVEPRMKA